MRPPATPAAAANSRPSGSSSAVHGFWNGPAAQRHERDELEAQRLDQVEGHGGERLAQHRAHEQRHQAADQEEEQSGADRSARADPQPCRCQAATRGEGDEDGVEDLSELLHAEVELGLEGGQPDEQAAHQPHPAQVDHGRVLAEAEQQSLGLALGRVGRAPAVHALGQEHGLTDEAHARAADEHQVRGAPESHVLAEEPVPHVVEREAQQGERARRGHQHATYRRAQAGDVDRRGADLLVVARERDRETTAREDAEEPDQDQVVGGVRQRALVASVGDVQRDVPVHPDDRDDQRAAGDAARQRGPARQAGHTLGEGGQARQRSLTAAAVAGDQVQHHRGGDAGAGGGDDHLVERGAPCGLCLCEE
jgi:hypothetical protein